MRGTGDEIMQEVRAHACNFRFLGKFDAYSSIATRACRRGRLVFAERGILNGGRVRVCILTHEGKLWKRRQIKKNFDHPTEIYRKMCPTFEVHKQEGSCSCSMLPHRQTTTVCGLHCTYIAGSCRVRNLSHSVL